MKAIEQAAPRISYRVAELVKLLGVPRSTLFDWLRTGVLPSIKVGKVRLVSSKDLQEFLARYRVPRGSQTGGPGGARW